jgi:hypothetical protein
MRVVRDEDFRFGTFLIAGLVQRNARRVRHWMKI